MIIMKSCKRFLNRIKSTAMAPPHEGERMGVSTSKYPLLISYYLSAAIILDRIFIIFSD